jgi:competence protein ComEA
MEKMKRLFVVCLAVFAVMTAMAGTLQAGDMEKVDINTATEKELTQLDKIGPAIAARIIEYRQKNGPFQNLEDIMNVSGIGQKIFESNKDRIAIGKPAEKEIPATKKVSEKKK